MRKGLEKAYEITDAKITFVSLVDKAANKRQFLLKKEDGGKATFTTYGRIVKADADNHYVTGIVYEPLTEDSHGNYMSEEEIIKAAYWYAKNGDKVDVQHSFEPLDGATVVENWVAKADFKIDEEEIKKGTWLMTMEISDADVWAGIEKGEITGFSMGGLGNYSEEDTDLENVSKAAEDEKKGLLAKVAAALGLKVVEKGAMAEIYEERSRGTLFWNALNTLEECLYHYDNITGRYVYEKDEAKVRECLEEFNAIITDLLTNEKVVTKVLAESGTAIEKAGKKISSKNKETLCSIYESLGMFLKEFDEPEDTKEEEPEDDKGKDKDKEEKEDKEVTKSEVEQIVAAAIQKSMRGTASEGTGTVEKQAGAEQTGAAEITPEAIEKMVAAAIEKAQVAKQEEQHLSMEEVTELIEKAVEKAVDPVLKSRGLPSNLNDAGTVKKQAEEHYLHGIL